MSGIDDKTLSRYLDGDLDYDEVNTIAVKLEDDAEARRMLLDMLKFQGLMRAMDREEKQTIPELHLESASRKRASGWWQRLPRQPIFQLAAALVLLISGFFYGSQGSRQPSAQDIFGLPAIPASLADTVGQVLEYDPSGAVREWTDANGAYSATVSPIKSYRNRSGTIYRIYFVDLMMNGNTKKLAGLAYRQDRERWLTHSVYTRNDTSNL